MTAAGERLKLYQRSLSAARAKKGDAGGHADSFTFVLEGALLALHARGSTAKYSRSTIRLMTTNMNAISTR